MAFTGAAVIGTVLSAVGTGISAFGAVQQAKYQQAVAKTNAKVAENNAYIASQKSQSEAEINDQQTRALIGEQLSVQSASGININSPSSVRVRRSTNKIGRADSLRIRQAGAYEIQNNLQQSNNFKAEAAAAGQNAKLAALSGVVGVASSLVPSQAPQPSLVSGAKTTSQATTLKSDPWIMRNKLNLRTVS